MKKYSQTETGKVRVAVETDLYSGWGERPADNFVCSWKGGKMTLPALLPMLEFFRKFGVEHEVTAVLFYNRETGEWKPWVFPQQYGTGLSVSSLPEDKRTEEQRAMFDLNKWVRAGTAHTHCTASAFQSSTDQNDERDVGIHMTFGHMNKPMLDFHARFVSEPNGISAPVDMHTFLDCETGFRCVNGMVFPLPSPIEQLCSARMETPSWPAEWKDNLIVVPQHTSRIITYGGVHKYEPMGGAAAGSNQSWWDKYKAKQQEEADDYAYDYSHYGNYGFYDYPADPAENAKTRAEIRAEKKKVRSASKMGGFVTRMVDRFNKGQ